MPLPDPVEILESLRSPVIFIILVAALSLLGTATVLPRSRFYDLRFYLTTYDRVFQAELSHEKLTEN